jgi:hypothetical protein
VAHYFLHVRRGREVVLDQEGCEFPSMEVARHETIRAARKAWQRVAPGQDPSAFSIEVQHESGVTVLSLAFADALKGDPLETR